MLVTPVLEQKQSMFLPAKVSGDWTVAAFLFGIAWEDQKMHITIWSPRATEPLQRSRPAYSMESKG
jgi:hypothetical protein